MWQAGDTVLLRSSYRGVVRWCWPHHYVGEWAGRHGIYVQPGSRGKLMRRALGKSYLDYFGWEDWRPPAAWRPLALPENWHVV